MCNPAVVAYLPQIIGAAVAVGGTALQVRAQNERDADMRRLNRAETERIDKNYKESQQYLNKNQETYERPGVEADMAAAANSRQAQYAAADANAPRANDVLPAGQNSKNTVVADAFARALEGAKTQAGQQGAARAELASFGDFITNAALANNERSNKIGMVGSFQQGSANVLPLELQQAATRTRGSATAGNLLTALGSAMIGSGGMGANTTVGAKTMGTAVSPYKSAAPLFSGFGG